MGDSGVRHRTIDITGIIEAGWADLTFSFDYRQHRIRASYLEDSLADLITACILIADGCLTTTCHFLNEPGEIELSFSCEDNALIISAQPLETITIDPADFWIETVPRIDFLRAVLRVFTQWEKSYPDEEYSIRWGYDFPAEKLAKLKKRIVRPGK
jgi:hypothetical protein